MDEALEHYKEESVFAKCLLHLVVVCFFFFCGEVYYTSILFGGGGKIKFLFLLMCALYAFLQNRNFESVLVNKQRLAIVVVWVLCCTYAFGQGNHALQWLDYAQFAVIMTLICSSISFERFRNLLLKYLLWLSAVSIVVQLGHDYFDLFPASSYIDARGEIRRLSLGLFNTEWGETRLASLFWEPGQYQIVIYYVLVLFADEWTDISNTKSSVRKFGVLVFAIILTKSTTGYLILGLVFLAIMMRSGRRYFKYIPLLAILSGVAMYYVINSEAVQRKVDQREHANSQKSSYTIRLADNLACLAVTFEDPLTGFGPGSDEMEDRLFSEGSETSSNGWFYGSAQLGIPYLIFIWICMWGSLKRINPKTNTLVLFLILVLSQANESVIYFPYIWMYVFRFPEQKHFDLEEYEAYIDEPDISDKIVIAETNNGILAEQIIG